MHVKLEDTYAEVFEGIYTRLIITAKDDTRLHLAANNSTALPSVVINRLEGGIEKYLSAKETPDDRVGAIIQFWGGLKEGNLKSSVTRFYKELSYRIRQGILVMPTTAIYNALYSEDKIDVTRRIGRCGDGYEYEDEVNGRKVIRIPLMMGEFIIERLLGFSKGIMGGNIWLLCDNEDSALEAGEKALGAIQNIEGVITPFGICSAGSKPETNFPEIGPTTNHQYCPMLKEKIIDSKVPEGVDSIPEIVINGTTINAVKEGMKVAIQSVEDIEGVIKISAGNYGGKLGKYKIFLKELFL